MVIEMLQIGFDGCYFNFPFLLRRPFENYPIKILLTNTYSFWLMTFTVDCDNDKTLPYNPHKLPYKPDAHFKS